jgi:membrane fusion protein (multidrug efflux system)
MQAADVSKVPAELKPVLASLHALYNACLPLANNPARKREMEDNSKRLGGLFWRLNEGKLSPAVAAKLTALCQALDAGKLKRASGSQAASVRLVMEDGSEFAQSGRLLFSDLTVDASSGQITLRAEVPNPQGTLLPGLYVRVRVEQAQASNAILLPQQAVTRSAQGDTVMVVGSDGKVKPRPVKVGAQQRNQWVILEGLQSGEQVMVDGFQKLRGDAPVKAVPWVPPGSKPAAPASAASAASAAAPAASAASATPAASAASR